MTPLMESIQTIHDAQNAFRERKKTTIYVIFRPRISPALWSGRGKLVPQLGTAVDHKPRRQHGNFQAGYPALTLRLVIL